MLHSPDDVFELLLVDVVVVARLSRLLLEHLLKHIRRPGARVKPLFLEHIDVGQLVVVAVAKVLTNLLQAGESLGLVLGQRVNCCLAHALV